MKEPGKLHQNLNQSSSTNREYFISIIIPTFNREIEVERAIESVLDQTYTNFELIVVDDGSTDNTLKILSQFKKHIKIIKTKNMGVSAARNVGIMEAKGTHICFLDSDDYWSTKKLERQVAALKKKNEYKIIYTNEIWIRNGRRVNQCKVHQKYSGFIFQNCLPLCIISPSSVMIERSVFEDVGVFDEDLPACEDYDLWLRITSKYKIYFLDENLIFKTGGHADQLSRKFWGMDRFRVKALIKILSSDLAKKDRKAVIKVLLKKCEILLQGSEKRGKTAESKQYAEIIKKYKKK